MTVWNNWLLEPDIYLNTKYILHTYVCTHYSLNITTYIIIWNWHVKNKCCKQNYIWYFQRFARFRKMVILYYYTAILFSAYEHSHSNFIDRISKVFMLMYTPYLFYIISFLCLNFKSLWYSVFWVYAWGIKGLHDSPVYGVKLA